MTQSARVVLVAQSGATNLVAAWQANPAASWASAPTANLPTFVNGSQSAWIRAAYSPSLNIIAAIASGGNNNNNSIVISGDGGANWIAPPGTGPDPAFTFTGITWAPGLGLFVAVASAGPTTTARVCTSPDGLNWTTRSLPTATIALTAVTCGTISSSDFLVAVGTNLIYTSTDAITWTSQTSPSSQSWSGVTWASGQSKFVACANSGGGTNNIMYSSNGTTWTSASTGGSGYSWTQIGYSSDLNQLIVVGGNTGVICYSAAGSVTSWTELSSGLGATHFTDVAWCHDQAVWVLVSTAPAIYTSTASNTGWTSQTVPNSNAWFGVVCLPASSVQSYCIGTDYPGATAINGTVGSSTYNGTTAAGLTLSATQRNELIILSIYNECLQSAGAYSTVSTVSGGSGLTWTKLTGHQWRGGRNGTSPFNYNNHEVWYAISSVAQSGQAITVTMSAAVDNGVTAALGIIGFDPTTPFDPNGSLPAVADGGTSGTASNQVLSGVSTTNAKPFVIASVQAPRAISGAVAPTGFVLRYDNGDSFGTDWGYQTLYTDMASSALSSATITASSPQIANWGMMAFAVQPVQGGDSGTMAPTEPDDTFSGTGALGLFTTWNDTEATDTMAASGFPGVGGPWASTEATDLCDPTDGGWTGTLTTFGGIVAGVDILEGKDTFSGAGYAVRIGVWISAEGPDTLNFFGKVTATGTWSSTEAKDTPTITGTVVGSGGTWVNQEPVDTFSAAGIVPPIGTFTPTEHKDTLSVAVFGAPVPRRRRIFLTN